MNSLSTVKPRSDTDIITTLLYCLAYAMAMASKSPLAAGRKAARETAGYILWTLGFDKAEGFEAQELPRQSQVGLPETIPASALFRDLVADTTLADLERDAMRYRFLRANPEFSLNEGGKLDRALFDLEDLDTRIDRALQMEGSV